MPFYFRIPLPGPFGYSKRIGGRRRRKPVQRQPVLRLTRAERQEQREQDARRARTFVAAATEVEHGEDGSLSFLAEFGVDHSGRQVRPPVQVTIAPGENDSVRRAISETEESGWANYLAVTFSPDMRTVESVDSI
jgi:hypothetical protein